MERCDASTERVPVFEEPFHPAQFYVTSITLEVVLGALKRLRPDRTVTRILRAEYVDASRQDAIELIVMHVGVEGPGYDVIHAYSDGSVVMVREFAPAEELFEKLRTADQHEQDVRRELEGAHVRVKYPCLPISPDDSATAMDAAQSAPQTAPTKVRTVSGIVEASLIDGGDADMDGGANARTFSRESISPSASAAFYEQFSAAYALHRPDRTLLGIVAMQEPVSMGKSQVEMEVRYALKVGGQYGQEVVRYSPMSERAVEVLREHTASQ